MKGSIFVFQSAKMFHIQYLILLYFAFLVSSCSRDASFPFAPMKTKHVFIAVMDGARYSETWGDSQKKYIPNLNQLAQEGTVCTSFYNEGVTTTVPGHTAMITGFYQNINNGGFELPAYSSVFQHYLFFSGSPPEDAWIFASKDKLEVLSDCTEPGWAGKFRPRTDCGISGNHSGIREDSVTFSRLVDTLKKYHPHLVLINFKQPDIAGHSNNWMEYIKQVSKTDAYIGTLWSYLQSDSIYKNTTALFVTNDHGRHPDGTADGFVSHGDNCDGCRHILLLAAGPDFKKGFVCREKHSLIDIPPTVSRLLNFNFFSGEGSVMNDIFQGL